MEQGLSQIHIRREALKFASGHMTVFPDGTKESLHGHNYTTEVKIWVRDVSLQYFVPFSLFKSVMAEICAEWDEKVLLPRECPYLTMAAPRASEVEFTLCRKRYVLPADEVVFLPLDNITTETLAGEFCRRLTEKLGDEPAFRQVVALEIKIEETPGQGASVRWQAIIPEN